MAVLKTKFNQQDHALEKLRENWKDDIEERKEIQMLKKIDQEENLLRTRNFYVIIRVNNICGIGTIQIEVDRKNQN